MSEKVLGIIRWPLELLYFMSDRVIFVPCVKLNSQGRVHGWDKEKEKEYLEWGLSEEEMGLVIPYSEITKIRLKKRRFLKSFVELEMITTTKLPKGGHSVKWPAHGLILDVEGQYKVEKKDAKIEDYENMLRPIFGDRLSVDK